MGRFRTIFASVGGATLALVGCTGGSPAVRQSAAASPQTTLARAMAFQLYTHCGIDEARIGSLYFEAVHPLIDDGNPPAGWGNPYQPGLMTLHPRGQAIFTDGVGHRVVFRLRPHATGFKHICS